MEYKNVNDKVQNEKSSKAIRTIREEGPLYVVLFSDYSNGLYQIYQLVIIVQIFLLIF
jgi:hypothetical protein